MKDTLLVSVSGGRTSAYMARWLQLNMADRFALVFVFMNTGQEHPATLDFLNECDRRWGWGLVWLEAVIDPVKGKATRYTEVDYPTACRDKRLFLDMCRKYGVPNRSYPHCNRELKLHPFEKFRNDRYPGAARAIGIRVDEVDRMSVKMEVKRIVYPLIKWHPTTKDQVLSWWRAQEFDLQIPEHYGNCKTCWKKSDRKLLTICHEQPRWFDDFEFIENDIEVQVASKSRNSGVFFRGVRSVADIRKEAAEAFSLYKDPNFTARADDSNGCSEHCEVWTDELDDTEDLSWLD